ncbi:hypothetical protein H696_06130 [Fonticula alba]|uniref:Uncharacterized protein n=1 Tax=Fonticula alba TaxID=691883 RepID=A0A058YZM8_FONAL|nr:hypothetical protein H696_06130 [Fonticula alba]KCV67435.1 hypothetical protein H696_06130 [Fonticula alba]|eukprot:XP_009498162.1 hypothetical protein H696_06130 [Fonticula alba]
MSLPHVRAFSSAAGSTATAAADPRALASYDTERAGGRLCRAIAARGAPLPHGFGGTRRCWWPLYTDS